MNPNDMMINNPSPIDPAQLLDLAHPVDLDPELQPYVGEVPGLGFPVLRHPLLYAVPYLPAMNAWLNQGFAQKRQGCAQALADRNYEHFVFLHERPYRLEAFLQIAPLLEDAAYWQLLRRIHVDTENAHEYMPQWHALWASGRPCREQAMTDDERARLAAMPDRFTIWHGVEHLGADRNVSWTLDRRIALWFARRFDKPAHQQRLARAQVAKKDVLAYIGSRNEEEIVVLPESLSDIRYERLR